MIKNFFVNEDISWEDLQNGTKRKILAYNDNLMLVEVEFEKGAIGAPHQHPHEQITYILSGTFEFEINGEKKVLKSGDSAYMEPNVKHGCVCLEAGRLLDVFTPHREDFFSKN